MELTTVQTGLATTSKYIRDFELLFVPVKVDQIRHKARNGYLAHCQFRSICWRYFLGCLPEDSTKWQELCAEKRKAYLAIKTKHEACKNPSNYVEGVGGDNNDDTCSAGGSNQNPSSSSASKCTDCEEKSYIPSNGSFASSNPKVETKNVYNTIERDVVRTFPEMEFFRHTEMQAILVNVLYNYASENPQLSYKQGMHELAATLLYVVHTDSQNCLINYQGGYADENIYALLDPKFIEYDVYHLFSSLMQSVRSWYQNDEILIGQLSPHELNTKSSINVKSNSSKQADSRRQQPASSVLGFKLNMISENILKSFDPELFNHLEALQIVPQIYGIRWMRLLFSREYDFVDLLDVWDAIICDEGPFSLIDYIFASMLITIREDLVNGDYTDCLNSLMRHQFKDVQYVINMALHLRDPQNYSRPKLRRSSSATTMISHKQSKKLPRFNFASETTSLTSKLIQHYRSAKQQIQKTNTRRSKQ